LAYSVAVSALSKIHCEDTYGRGRSFLFSLYFIVASLILGACAKDVHNQLPVIRNDMDAFLKLVEYSPSRPLVESTKFPSVGLTIYFEGEGARKISETRRIGLLRTIAFCATLTLVTELSQSSFKTEHRFKLA
jgi:hypothetical protein